MEEKRSYKYCGPEDRPARVNHENPLSPQNAVAVIKTAWAVGRVHSGTHFKKRCVERGIDMLDIENIIASGTLQGKPEYCEDYKTWKYIVAGITDERHLEVVIALDSNEDYVESPLAILVTAYEKGQRGKP